MTIVIRQLGAEDWAVLKSLRLAALQTDPGVFSSTHDEEKTKSEAAWRAQLDSPKAAIFALFDGAEPIGMTGVAYDRDDPLKTTAVLWGSWLRPDYRGRGLSEMMYRARLDWAESRADIERVIVGHRESNLASKHANQKHGFTYAYTAPHMWRDGKTEGNPQYVRYIRSRWGRFPIESERLVIRPPLVGDAAALCAAKMETLDQLKLWMPWAHSPQSVEADETMIQNQASEHARGEDCMLFAFDRQSGFLVASTGLHRPDWENKVFEIGYWVRKQAQGRGYAQEVTRALIRHAFDELSAQKIVMSVAEGNDASRAVIEKCGFTFTHEKIDEKDGKLTRWYAITRASA